MVREAWQGTVHGLARVGHDIATEHTGIGELTAGQRRKSLFLRNAGTGSGSLDSPAPSAGNLAPR